MIDIDPQVQQESEPEGYEFGYYTFDTLPVLEVSNIETSSDTMLHVDNIKSSNDVLWELPIDNKTLSELQQKDMFCNNLLKQIEKGNIKEGQLYIIKGNMLKRYVVDGNNTFETVIIPRVVTAQILQMAHDNLGHNGTHRTYTLLKRLYYWKGLKLSVASFQCNTLRCKNKYALTVICMLMGYVFCVPLKTKTAEEVIQAYIDNVCSKFGGSMKILSDNGTKFKNKIFEQVAKELGIVHKLYTPPYYPASNGRIEGFHAFLTACIAKHIAPQLEWDALVPLACAAYNFIPNEHSKESPFFLMFGRDPVSALNTLLEPKIRYMGNDVNVLSLEAMKNMFEIAATNLKLA